MTPLRVAMRCDANSTIGAGHVMRCHALGQRLTQLGHSVDFIGEFREMDWVATELVEYCIVREVDARWDFYDAVVIDSYFITESEVDHFTSHGCLVVLIADDATPSVSADLYVQPGIVGTWQPPMEAPGGVPHVSGLEALLLRQEIIDAATRSQPLSGRGSLRVGVLLGASGSPELALNLLTQISTLEIPCTFVMTGNLRHLESSIDNDLEILWLDPGHGGIEVLVNSDVIVSAAGVTAWEALYLRRPLGLLVTASNQEQNYEYMTANGLAWGLGRIYLEQDIDIASLEEFLIAPKLNTDLPVFNTFLTDGLGATRVAHQIEQLTLDFRRRGSAAGGQGGSL